MKVVCGGLIYGPVKSEKGNNIKSELMQQMRNIQSLKWTKMFVMQQICLKSVNWLIWQNVAS